MTKIRTLFVCRGNTCRSPLCESLFNNILDANLFLKETFEYAKSAGVQTYTHKVSNGAMKIGAVHGLAKRIKEHQCTQFQTDLFDEYDHILCMDTMNRDHLAHFSKNVRSAMKKVEYLRSYDPNSDGVEIDDPIGADLSTYESTYQQCLSCIVEYMESKTAHIKHADINISKFSKNGFSSSKISVIFICDDNLTLSPLCEAIFNKRISEDEYLSEKYNQSSSVRNFSRRNSGWGESCPDKLITLMEETHHLDLSMHETDCFSTDVYKNDVVVTIGDKARDKMLMRKAMSNKNEFLLIPLKESDHFNSKIKIENKTVGFLYQKSLEAVNEVLDTVSKLS